jgi:hypothetical protein
VRLEMREAAAPVLAPFGGKHAVELLRRHVVRIVAQTCEDGRELGRKHVARIHRDHLAELHRRTAEVGELIGNARGVGGGEQEVADLGAFSVCEAPGALCDDAAGDATREFAEDAEAGEAAARDRTSGAVAAVFGHGCSLGFLGGGLS